MTDKEFRKVKNISSDLEEYYRKYFERNATKFIWKWNLKMEDLESIWISEGCEYSIIGQVSEHTFILKNNGDDSRWFVSGAKFIKDFSRK
jgi:hypothetical protein